MVVPVDWMEAGKHVKRQLWSGIDLLLGKIKNRGLAQWTVDLHSKWPQLTRKTLADVQQNPERHSLIHLPHPFVVHGPEPSRYREQHYWESYFIIHGLLISGMHATAKGMILNFAHLIDRFGHIPLANRVYYLERTNPPLLSAMVNLYWLHQSADHPQDGLDLIKAVLPAVQREYDFWMKERSVDVTVNNGQTFQLNRYQGTTTKPRPEGYREDHETSRSLRNRTLTGVEDKFYGNIAAASESGWEFSSRWLDQPAKSGLAEIRTQDIIPVDLNAFLCQTERHLAFFYNQIGDKEKNMEYERKSEKRGDAIHAVFWNNSAIMWRDFDLKHNKQRSDFYLSSLTPLFASCSPKNNLYAEADFLRRVASSADVQRLASHPGGLPVSFVDALGACHSCQWDFPNSWPTAALYLIEPLAKSDQEELRSMAKNWAQKVVSSVYDAMEQGVEISEK
ncbi:Treh, partial [Ramazzottius varieornatus]